MDINCTSNCSYQVDGKCTLVEVPTFTEGTSYESDCPYFYNNRNYF